MGSDNTGTVDHAVHGDMSVWEIYRRHPQTLDVFFRYGCPDIRRGAFPLLMRVVKLKWVARVHRARVEDMVRDLNAVAALR